MIITRMEAHDLLTDLERNRAKLAPATLRLLRQIEDAYQLMSPHSLAEVGVHVKRTSSQHQ